MLKLVVVLQLLVLAVSVRAAQLKLDQLKVGAVTFTNVTVMGANATDLYFSHSKGISNVKLKYLPPDLQKRFHYDPKEAAVAEKQQSEDDVRYQGELAAAAARSSQSATNGTNNLQGKLLDSLTDKSWLGKSAPSLTFGEWIGDKPELKNKYTLLWFIASWSVPCQKSLAQVSGIQKKLGDKVQALLVSAESKTELEPLHEKFPLPIAVDPKSALAGALGISTIPTAVLIDPKSKVLYVGHPGGLNEASLEQVVNRKE